MFLFEEIKLEGIVIYIIKYNSFKIEQHYSILNHEEKNRISEFSSLKRKQEFISTRILKSKHFPDKQICYSPSGAPFIDEEIFISISHTLGCSSIATSNKHIIGLDIEPKGTKACKLHTKFLNSEELSFLDTSNPDLMTRSWSCKEALLKLCNTKGLIFKKDLLIHSFDGNESFECSFNKNGKQYSVTLRSIVLETMIVTINQSEPKLICQNGIN